METQSQNLNAWLNRIFDSELPPNAKLIASYINSYYSKNNDGLFPTKKMIKAGCSLSEETVEEYVHILINENWIFLSNNPCDSINKFLIIQKNEANSQI
ncbi:MAG: hypothetical protein CL691_00290 [Cellvibrionales bacterium]|nr:hypothetical protein [Cellvibrionales bacterium]|tara:strand:+ start:2331 stop:2627 length:297 start_codon:yes stop_codon:yes gene_type:complete